MAWACDAPLATPDGPRPAGALDPGDLVTTLDGGAEPVLWRSAPARLPVVRLAGARVTSDCLVLRRDPLAGLLFGNVEVLARAGDLAPRAPGRADCVAILLAGHGLARVGANWCGTFLPDAASLAALAPDQRRALRRAHPRAGQLCGQAGYLIGRPVLDPRALAVLRAAAPSARG
ncbi:Hint domain-containing protein [Palleronia sp. KMU-117]|uniref:Hint domain-containing protein n=1 Tax=Palleronia sp. KMU-117 TaxID=3434108 RepID=UPI003D72B241